MHSIKLPCRAACAPCILSCLLLTITFAVSHIVWAKAAAADIPIGVPTFAAGSTSILRTAILVIFLTPPTAWSRIPIT